MAANLCANVHLSLHAFLVFAWREKMCKPSVLYIPNDHYKGTVMSGSHCGIAFFVVSTVVEYGSIQYLERFCSKFQANAWKVIQNAEHVECMYAASSFQSYVVRTCIILCQQVVIINWSRSASKWWAGIWLALGHLRRQQTAGNNVKLFSGRVSISGAAAVESYLKTTICPC